MDKFKSFILRRVDGKEIDYDLPKSKKLKIIIKCSICGFERQSNSYDVLSKKSTLCSSCVQIEKYKNNEYNLSYRKTKEYREMMSKSVSTSEKWKKTIPERAKIIKKYWENIRGYKFEEIKDKWYMYRRIVYNLTEQTYKQHENIINPNNVNRGRGKYHLDHKYSVLEGFKNNIPPYILSHPFNLQMLPEKINISKDYRCDITMRELFEGVFGSERNIYGS